MEPVSMQPVVPADRPMGPKRRRLKIDEIDAQWHCAIIGTCLTLGELKSLATKLDITLPMGSSGYNLHASMVHLASQNHRIAKALTKCLDHRHTATINRFAKAGATTELADLWTQALEKGDVASAAWAVMSHPQADDNLRKQVFQDVHMLSHQVGAAARADLRQIYRLEREKADLESKVDRQQTHLRIEITRRDQENETLRRCLDEALAETRQLAHAAVAAKELERLRSLVAELQNQLTDEVAQHRETRREKQVTADAIITIERRLEQLTAKNHELIEEVHLYEAKLGEALALDTCAGDCEWNCNRPDLCGRCILFVGGRHQQMAHVRRLVEDCNGVFAHHDGGVEESLSRLHGLFGRADAVLFPVDCVSHSAQDAVKQLCRRWQKPFVPVRRSGLGAYLAALETVAERH
ncbi:DUF2325 domain-containing protein [Telmatospirillum sp.]|uniref:DUF2325 domain-containing protein n=1 Tax=Telmatospirillum sp. TaxID=2079197 RepID=UPI00283F7920|nr:DUF2325 domain-containing protein [Telmatospirillum sp.]MDR3437900.1 DUF2325 domain-containing protein [Telmatospirillum sp.]